MISVHTIEALTESETRFRGTFENAAVGIAHIGLDGAWVRVNQRLCDIIGSTREELLGRRYQDITHPDDLEPDLIDARRLMAGEIGSYSREMRYLRRDGSRVWVKVTRSLTQGAAGTPDYFILVVDDISLPKQMEHALAESEARYRLVADHTYDWECWVGPDGALRYVSPSCQRIAGRSAEEFLADPGLLLAITHPADRPAVGAHLAGESSQAEPQQIQFRILTPDQEIRWVEHACQPVYTEDGSFAGRRASIRDITDRKQAEEVLRRREAQLAALAENSPDIIARFDRSLRHLYVNAAVERATGRPPQDFLGKTNEELGMPPHVCKAWRQTLGEVLRTGETRNTELAFPAPDGERYYSLRAVPELAPDGSVATVLATTRDETARRQAEAQTRLLAAVVETSQDFIGIANLEGQALYLNRAGQALVGLADDTAARATRIEDYLFPEDIPFVRETVMPAILREGHWAGEFRFRHFRTGESIAVHWDVVRIDNPDTGEPVRLATVTRDIRKDKAVEEAQREADRRKDEFLAVLGHELRNPMAPIRSAVEIMQRLCPGDPQIRWALGVLDRQTAHMSRLLDDLLDVSRIVRGRLKLNRRPINVADVISQAVEGVAHLIEERHHRFMVEPPTEYLEVDADPVRLAQVLLNLLSNAANYTDEGGEIQLIAAGAADEVVLTVRDTGRGIRPELIRRIFDPFSQGERRQVAREHTGLGLGLTIASRLVEMHGGHMEATSDGPGRGSQFRVHLPRLLQPAAHQTETKDPQEVRLPSLRVLVVDDNPDVANAMALVLKMMGQDAKVALSGTQALDMARELRPQLALLDIGMPQMDGLELARRLRQAYPNEDLRIIAMSGYGHDEAIARSLAAGFDDHLVKPVDSQLLRAVLAKAT
jgi:PAS domain S-box-containing protein